MAEITKITTPILPQESLGPKMKPTSDQGFDLMDPSKVNRPDQDGSAVRDQRTDGGVLRDGISRDMLAPLFRSPTEMVQIFQKITVMLQMGISTSDVVNNPEIQKLLQSLFIKPEQMAGALIQQDSSSVLFKGQAFDVLRDILGKFQDSPKVRDAVANLLKAFEQNVNTENSVKTILLTSRNLLAYMFSKDRAQFAEYLDGLGRMLLPGEQEAQGSQAAQTRQPGQTGQTGQAGQPGQAGQAGQAAQTGEAEQTAQTAQTQQAANADGAEKAAEAGQRLPEGQTAAGKAASDTNAAAGQPKGLGIDHREAAQILKGNLLPLLGEIVVKYNQNNKIRDMVMVVVHNIVRVDQGSPESLRDSVARLIGELRQLANMPPDFEKNLTDAIFRNGDQVRNAQNETVDKLSELITRALASPESAPAAARQAENLLLSMLQNQNSAMNLLHFILPMDTPNGKLFAEMYVDPDNDEKVSRSNEDNSRKIFLAFDSESLGAFEFCFLESGARVDFSMWCPEQLVKNLNDIKRQVAEVMQLHGYTMNSYQVAELTHTHNIAEVFPKLLNRRMGVDVRI